MNTTRIGLFFGSFNPVHVGHLIIAEAALNATDLHEVWLVVSPQNPFKDKKSLLDENSRYWIVQLAVEDNPRLRASNVEFSLPRPSYTITTLLHLREKHPTYEFSLIMGEDNLDQLHNWKNYEAILKYYRIFCYPRKTSSGGGFEKYPQIIRFEFPHIDVSATMIRDMIREGKSTRYLLTEPVHNYILQNRYYAD